MKWIICFFIGHSGGRFALAGGYRCDRCGRKARIR